MAGRSRFPRVTSIALLYAVLHLLIVAPLSAQLGHLKKQEATLKQAFKRAHLKSIMFDDLLLRQQKINDLDKALKTRLPVQLDEARARKHLEQLAQARAVRLDHVQTLPETVHEFYALTSLTVEGQAEYRHFVDLIQAINVHTQLGWCDDLSIYSVTEDPRLIGFSMRCDFPDASEGV